ncbi:glycosyltransferase family 2 protein [Desulforhopalus vacuolatus]|uniref:glycosyltransferase family 2 protein n=1 Tax=Desulforhopalus vacuolatus TaxID=40414 RepID=UPI001962F019|nr:glycosyltransferase family 2 protein [Desulforhopalus vacuolatus]MBM9521192.1 glycosyltransferase family 2 protein [Desulforhopalus vacuolatus]
MVFFQILFLIVLSLVFLACLWLFLLTIGAWMFTPKKVTDAPFLKMGVLIPAHNEELQMEQTIAAVRRCHYPEELLDIFVIADNCSDRTADVARSCGAAVAERHNLEMRGKGQALDWFLTSQTDLYGSCDLLTIIDADVAPEEDYFKELNCSLSHPEVQVVQAYNGVANPYDSWRTALVSAAFNVFNHLRMAGSVRLFGTATLKGNGMGFRREILQTYGWPAHSVVEDVEFSLTLLEDRVDVHYNPDAVIRSEMAVSRSQASSQRERWEGGRFALARELIPRLAGKCLQGEFRYFHALMDLAVPPLSLLIAAILFSLAASWLLFPSTLPIGFACLLISVIYVASGQLLMRAPLRLWCYLASAPVYIVWKMLLYLKMALRGSENTWTRTTRKSELDNQDN